MALYHIQNYARHISQFGFLCFRLRKFGVCSPLISKVTSLQRRSFTVTFFKCAQVPIQSADPVYSISGQKTESEIDLDHPSAIPLSASSSLNQHLSSTNVSSNISSNAVSVDTKSSISNAALPSINTDAIVDKISPSPAISSPPLVNSSASESESELSVGPRSNEPTRPPSGEGDIGKELAGALNTSTLLYFYI